MTEKCEYCNSIYWKKKFCQKKKSCCHKSKLRLSELSPFPFELQQIFCDKSFRNDIRIFDFMLAFATFQADITSDRQLPILKVHTQIHHIAPTCLYGSNKSNKSYCGQICI